MVVRYRHRINNVEDLATVPADMGIELDLRSDGPDILIVHNPFEPGLKMDEFFPHLRDRPLILNVKCEGIVDPVLEACRRHRLEDFFFLGLSKSDTIKCVRAGERRVANYYSEYNHPSEPLAWKGLIDWLWIECWTRYPVEPALWAQIAESFKLCIGSPELYGHPQDGLASFMAPLQDRRYHGVCTKRPDLWTS